MTKLQILAASISCSLLALPLLGAGALSRYRVGDEVSVTILRNGKRYETRVKLQAIN